MVIHVQLDFGDCLQAHRLYRESTSDNSLMRLLGSASFLFLGGWLLINLLVDLWNRPHELASYWPLVAFFCLAGGIILFDIIPKSILWFAFRLNRKHYLEPREVTFDEGGVTVRLPKVRAEYEWNFYSEGVEGPHHFILIFGKVSYLTIPKKVFQEEKEVESFRSMLTSHLPKFKQKLKIPLNF